MICIIGGLSTFAAMMTLKIVAWRGGKIADVDPIDLQLPGGLAHGPKPVR
jgi:hypothetical protein